MPSRTLIAPGATAGAQQVNNTFIPWPYEVWADGVYQRGPNAVPATPDLDQPLPPVVYAERKRIAYRPVWLSGIGHTVDTEEPLIKLSYLTVTGEEQHVWLGRAYITDHQKLASLGGQGLPFDSVNAKQALAYLRAQEALNGPLFTTLKVGHRSGPYIVDGRLGWLVGSRWVGHGEMQADPRGGQRYVAAFSQHGDADEWYNKWRELRQVGWVTRFLMGATFAPPLLRHLKCRTFIVHHWGDSSHGKTATAVFALSAWGNPELLYSSLNRTAISITEVFKHLTDLPVLYDEKQVSTVTSEELIYSICTGSGRERGARDGGVRQDKPTWWTVARTTGEVPLITDSDVGGQFNRVLQIHSVAFQDRRQAEAIYPFTHEHHGFAGPKFLEHLGDILAQPGGLDMLLRINREFREALVNRIGIDSNHAAYGAVIATAQMLAEVYLLGVDANEAREQALEDAFMAVQETAPKKQLSYAERALSKLRDHWVSNPAQYADETTREGRERSERMYRMVGLETPFGMAFVPHEANEVLMRANYEPARVWRDFDNRGWLVKTEDSALTTLNLRNGRSVNHQVYLVKPDIFFSDAVRRTRLQLISGGQP